MSYEVWGDGDDYDPFERAREDGWLDPGDLSKATIDVIAERNRQQDVEGWTPEHDDQHERGELAHAAATYAYAAGLSDKRRANISGNFSIENNSVARELWPFATIWWKLTNRRRDLVKAAALILAEIERLDRAEAKAAKP